jgi:hypothetical protein
MFFMTGINAMNSVTNFKELKRPSSPNYYLACPPGFCNIKPDKDSPVFPVSVQILRSSWLNSIKSEPRFKLLYSKNDHYEYVQRSLIFRFPDYVSVCLISHGEGRSSIALLSRSKYGYYDFGVNKKRVERLLKNLNKEVKAHVKK